MMTHPYAIDRDDWITLVFIAVVAIVIVHKMTSRLGRKVDVKHKLQCDVDSALRIRNTKYHECLLGATAPTRAIRKESDVDHEGKEKDQHFYSAAETKRLVAEGILDPAENVRKLALRCRKYGRNNKTDSGVNAITEEFYDEAYIRAQNLNSKEDSSEQNNDGKIPLLYGVPISVKDCLAMKGALQTGGLACRTSEEHRSTDDSLLVDILRNTAYALPMVRGNVGQLMMLPESYNRVWGRTRNPWDLSRVPGGSSGGEAALVAMKCVPLAVGSDVGGSIRIPSAFCGIVGFKPTSTRLSKKGSMVPRKDNKIGSSLAIPAVVGPLARTVEDCALFMEAVSVPKLSLHDCTIPPLSFNRNEYESTKPLKFGYFVTDGWFEPCSASKRAVKEMVFGLQKAGHECVKFELPVSGWDTYALLVKINAADGNMRQFKEGLEGEEMIDSYDTLRKVTALPNFLRSILPKFIDKRRGHLVNLTKSGGISVHDYWQHCAELLEMRAKWSDAMISAGIDVILHPALPTPAIPHYVVKDFTAAFSYLFIANLLMWPSGVVPVTTVKEGEEHYRMEDIPETQRDRTADFASKVMEGSQGLPIGVAVMARAYCDETCLRGMREVEKVAQFVEEPTAYLNVE